MNGFLQRVHIFFCRLMRRERSDSVDSHSTTASLSTDDSEISRAATPDIRPESAAAAAAAYLPMNLGKQRPVSSGE